MPKQWIQVIQLVAIPKDDVVAVNAGGREIALYSVGDEIYATDNACSHGNARLCDGFLDGHEIECPLHQGRFDVRTGRAMCEPLTGDVEVFGVRVEGGGVFVEV